MSAGHGQHGHAHGHGHHHHGHRHPHGGAAPAGPDSTARAHGEAASARRLLVALSILGTFTLIEALGGYLANSLALLAEAAHMLADCGSLLLAIFAIRVGQRPASRQRTYGHRRYQPLAAFVNGQLLMLLTVWVVYEAVVRLMHLPVVNGRLMLGIALLGGLANLAAFVALSGSHSLN